MGVTLEPLLPDPPRDPYQWRRLTDAPDGGWPNVWIRPCPGTVYPAVDFAVSRAEPAYHADPSLCHVPWPEWVAFCERIKAGDLDYLDALEYGTVSDGSGQAPGDERPADHDGGQEQAADTEAAQ